MNEDVEICQICWNENIEDSFTTLSCCPKMSYHSSCIKNWFEISVTCPFCRTSKEIWNRCLLSNINRVIDIPEARIGDSEETSKFIICYIIITISIIVILLFYYFLIYNE